MEKMHWDRRRQTWICPYDNSRMCYNSLRVGEAFDYTCNSCEFRYGDFSQGTFEEEAEKYKSRISKQECPEKISKQHRHIHPKRSDFRKIARQTVGKSE